MAFDYDLSSLRTDQVELWICLQADDICGQIMADQAKRLGFPLTPGHSIVSTITGKPQVVFNIV